MPTYDYECQACAHHFEAFQRFSEKLIRLCPACGKKRVRRLIGAGGALLFKGSGFYITDYRSESYKTDAKADQGGGSSSPSQDTSGKGSSGKADQGGGSSSPSKDTSGKGSSGKGNRVAHRTE